MATWPDTLETIAYIGEVTADQQPVLEQALNAAIAYIGWRCDGQLLEDDDYADIVPDNLREATFQLTSRLFRRRLSAEGDFGAVRVTSVDPDIELLITANRSWGFA